VALFIGIMSASQIKALNNSVNPQVAVAIGFRAATLVLVIFVLAGLCLSFALRWLYKNNYFIWHFYILGDKYYRFL